MPVPKRKTSKARRDRRSAGTHKVYTVASVCSNCQSFKEQHAVCQGCGVYKGIKVMRTKSERANERAVMQKMREQSLEEAQARRKLEAAKQAQEATGHSKE